eukprot:5488352-Pleurochrysis_carterae.AAC.1
MASVNACSVSTGAVLLLPCRRPTDCSACGPVINVARPIYVADAGYPDSNGEWRLPHGARSPADANPP